MRLSKADLTRIEADDILKSRVFSDGDGAAGAEGDDTSYEEAYSDDDSRTDEDGKEKGEEKGKAHAEAKSMSKH